LGTVNYLASDSITDLANNISAIAGVTATVISDTGTFKLEIVSDSNVALSFTNDTGGVVGALNITDAGSSLISANIGGAADGSDDGTATVSGNTITVTDQSGAEGLKLFYSGNGDASGIQLDFTVGLGTRLFFALDRLLDTSTGVVATDITTLQDQNELTQERIDRMLARLEHRRQQLIDRFITLETALARAEQIRRSIQTTFDALFANRR
jgi:flagellar hook-associated protein 2